LAAKIRVAVGEHMHTGRKVGQVGEIKK